MKINQLHSHIVAISPVRFLVPSTSASVAKRKCWGREKPVHTLHTYAIAYIQTALSSVQLTSSHTLPLDRKNLSRVKCRHIHTHLDPRGPASPHSLLSQLTNGTISYDPQAMYFHFLLRACRCSILYLHVFAAFRPCISLPRPARASAAATRAHHQALTYTHNVHNAPTARKTRPAYRATLPASLALHCMHGGDLHSLEIYRRIPFESSRRVGHACMHAHGRRRRGKWHAVHYTAM